VSPQVFLEEGGLGIDRKKLMRWWKNREKIKSSTHKNKPRKIISEKVRTNHHEMETKLVEWITFQRSLGVCISGFTIRVKAMELEREIRQILGGAVIFKASQGWLYNFLRRNKLVLRRITTTGRELPDNCIETILSFISEMEKLFGPQEDVNFDSLINMDETCIYIDMPSNYKYEQKVF
jgi:hypothetical protein